MPKKNINCLSNFETLITKNDICFSDRWHPHSVSAYENNVSQGILSSLGHDLKKNIAYNLQYIEYMELQLNELYLHSVITTMLYKNYIITGVSIIEGVFYYLLKSNGLWTKKEWELEKTIKSNPITFENVNRKFEVNIFRKIEITDDEMNLDSMIKKIESHNLIDIPHEAFPYIKSLRRLRNKVHLQINEHSNDTDWNSYNDIDYLWMKYILYRILTNSKFNLSKENKDIYSFLKLADKEMEKLKRDVQNSQEAK